MVDHQKNWLTIEKECYAVVWAVAYFRYYLESVEFEVVTDNYALKWLQTSLGQKNPISPKLKRWIMELSPYNFTISYRPGKDNGVPDALSRNPFFQADNLELPFLLYSTDKDDKAPEINAKQSKDVFCKKLADLIKAKQTEKFFYDNHLTLKRRTIINGIERHRLSFHKVKYSIS